MQIRLAKKRSHAYSTALAKCVLFKNLKDICILKSQQSYSWNLPIGNKKFFNKNVYIS